eukprot:scaffold54516_cov33-Phaeocystis_antarctica.AAC.2
MSAAMMPLSSDDLPLDCVPTTTSRGTWSGAGLGLELGLGLGLGSGSESGSGSGLGSGLGLRAEREEGDGTSGGLSAPAEVAKMPLSVLAMRRISPPPSGRRHAGSASAPSRGFASEPPPAT